MSLSIAVYVNDGIVMASDSRISISDIGADIDGVVTVQNNLYCLDSADKTFLLNGKIGLTYASEMTFSDISLSELLKRFCIKYENRMFNFNDVPDMLMDWLKQHVNNPKAKIIVAGYDKADGKTVRKIFKVNTKTGDADEIDSDGKNGALWIGATDTMKRLFETVYIKNKDTGELSNVLYDSVEYSHFSLQDAVDFARYAIETTMRTLHFKNKQETVGGPVDILVIKPDEAFWLQSKKLS